MKINNNNDDPTIFDYLITLSRDHINILYGKNNINNNIINNNNNKKKILDTSHTYVCRAVFQSLPYLVKIILMRFLALPPNEHIYINDIKNWIDNNSWNLMTKQIQRAFDLNILIKNELNNKGDDDIILKKKDIIIIDDDENDNNNYWVLNEYWQYNMRKSLVLLFNEVPWIEREDEIKHDSHKPSKEELSLYQEQTWEKILHFLVGSEAYPEPKEDVVNALLADGLIILKNNNENDEYININNKNKKRKRNNNNNDNNENKKRKLEENTLIEDEIISNSKYIITKEGYEFMLKDIHSQIWRFIYRYLCDLKERNDIKSHNQILLFIFQLSYCRVGEAYPISKLTESQLFILHWFRRFGLIYQRKKSSKLFYPTQVGVNLIFGNKNSSRYSIASSISNNFISSNNENQNNNKNKNLSLSLNPSSLTLSSVFIIVQTNYQIIIYTQSELHVATVSLFSDIKVRLPNMAIGIISRESAYRAFKTGITTRQIIKFLEMKAHPSLLTEPSIIPINILDQLKLWENEGSRLQARDATLIKLPQTLDIFQCKQIIDYSKRKELHLWSSDDKRTLIVIPDQIELIYEAINGFN